MKDQWVRQSLFVFGALILPQAALYIARWRSVLTVALAVFVLLFVSTSRRKSVSTALCLFTAVCAAWLAHSAQPRPEALRRLDAARRHQGGNNPLTVEFHCSVLGNVRYPSPGEALFDCAERRAESALTFRLSTADLPWNEAWDIQSGDEIKTVVRLSPVSGRAEENPFSYEAYLFRRGIAGMGQIETLSRVLLHRKRRPSIAQRVLAQFGDTEGSAVMLAGVLGLKDLLNDELNLLFRRTGTSHLVVVSGFHVGVLFFALSLLIRFTAGRSTVLLSCRPLEPVSAALACFGAWAYLPLVGADISILRALVALTMFAASKIFSRDACAPRTLSVTLAAVFLMWPGAFFEAGCQLTFLAVLGLLAGASAARLLRLELLPRIRRYVAKNLLYGLSAWLFTAPAVLVWFESYAPLAPIYNICAVPIFSAVTLLSGGAGILLFACSPALGSAPIRISIAGTDLLLRGLKYADAQAATTSVGFLELAPTEARLCACLIAALLGVALYVLSCFRLQDRPNRARHGDTAACVVNNRGARGVQNNPSMDR